MIHGRLVSDFWWMMDVNDRLLESVYRWEALNRFDWPEIEPNNLQRAPIVQPDTTCILPEDVDPMDPIH